MSQLITAFLKYSFVKYYYLDLETFSAELSRAIFNIFEKPVEGNWNIIYVYIFLHFTFYKDMELEWNILTLNSIQNDCKTSINQYVNMCIKPFHHLHKQEDKWNSFFETSKSKNGFSLTFSFAPLGGFAHRPLGLPVSGDLTRQPVRVQPSYNPHLKPRSISIISKLRKEKKQK